MRTGTVVDGIGGTQAEGGKWKAGGGAGTSEGGGRGRESQDASEGSQESERCHEDGDGLNGRWDCRCSCRCSCRRVLAVTEWMMIDWEEMICKVLNEGKNGSRVLGWMIRGDE